MSVNTLHKGDDDDDNNNNTGIRNVYPVNWLVGQMRNVRNEQNIRAEHAWKTEGIQMIILISILGDQNLRMCSEYSSIRMVCGSGFCIN